MVLGLGADSNTGCFIGLRDFRFELVDWFGGCGLIWCCCWYYCFWCVFGCLVCRFLDSCFWGILLTNFGFEIG